MLTFVSKSPLFKVITHLMANTTYFVNHKKIKINSLTIQFKTIHEKTGAVVVELNKTFIVEIWQRLFECGS